MIPSFLDKSKLPRKSGVYQFLDNKGQVLYVGKAIDLYHRVASYFSRDVGVPLRPRSSLREASEARKTAALVSKVAAIETIIVESELEALILEANLIKKYHPAFNVRLMDDKDYLYIGITKEDFPKVVTIRKQDLKKVKKFFGPFPSGRTVRDTLKLLRRVFPWCSNPPKSTLQPSRLQAKYRACFYYHLGLCPGACVRLINKEDYHKIIRRFSKFLEGKKEELVREVSAEMMKLAKDQNYEEAYKFKKTIEGIAYLTQTNRTRFYLENPNFLEEENKLAQSTLQKDLNLAKLPARIEGYDISNIQGREAVGSLVVITYGEIDKSQYRKFKIKSGFAGPNDVGMHKEMIRRRLNHPEWPIPNLIIVDGGRAQARAVSDEVQNRGYQIPIFGLAKRMEWLYPPQGELIKLPKKSLSLRLLQKLRDESHRFAISYHRKLRDRIKT